MLSLTQATHDGVKPACTGAPFLSGFLITYSNCARLQSCCVCAAFGSDFHDLSRLTDMGASLTSADEAALQGVLEELSVPARCPYYQLAMPMLLLNCEDSGMCAVEKCASITLQPSSSSGVSCRESAVAGLVTRVKVALHQVGSQAAHEPVDKCRACIGEATRLMAAQYGNVILKGGMCAVQGGHGAAAAEEGDGAVQAPATVQEGRQGWW